MTFAGKRQTTAAVRCHVGKFRTSSSREKAHRVNSSWLVSNPYLIRLRQSCPFIRPESGKRQSTFHKGSNRVVTSRNWYAVEVPMGGAFAERVEGRIRTRKDLMIHPRERRDIRYVFFGLNSLIRKRGKPTAMG